MLGGAAGGVCAPAKVMPEASKIAPAADRRAAMRPGPFLENKILIIAGDP